MGWCQNCRKDCPEQPDYASGRIFCAVCGLVIKQDVFTEEPTFVKGAGGETRVGGSFVRSIQYDYSQSYRRTLDKGAYQIEDLAGRLGMEDESARKQAEAFYRIAVERNFTKGRRTEQVAAACLYIACRHNKKPYLLIDFSICLTVNVYVLGAVFLQLCKVLSLQEHPIVQKPVDPSLFIDRFTSALVGERNLRVSRTALNIIASMKRDWMQTGRKPSGLCGAAVYISALSHGFKCSKLEIVKVVHVCEATLTKRLIEFENTNSGSLTIEEFNKRAAELEEEDKLRKLSDANSQNFKTLEVLCEHKHRKPHYVGLCESCYEDLVKLSGGFHGGAEPPAFQRAERERLAKSSSEKVKDLSFVLKPHQDKTSSESANEMEVEHFTEANQNVIEAETVELTETTTASSIGDEATINDTSDIVQKSNDMDSAADGPDSLSDIDDVEVNGYLNNEEESYYKKIIWEEMNKEYLQEQAAKEAAAAASGVSGAHQLAVAKAKEERRKKRALEAKNANPAQSAAEAASQMLTRKKLSSKINYDVLEKLFDDNPAPDAKKSRIESQQDRKVDGQQQLGDETNEENTANNNGEQEEIEENEEYVDEWYCRNENEDAMPDYVYYDNDGDDEY